MPRSDREVPVPVESRDLDLDTIGLDDDLEPVLFRTYHFCTDGSHVDLSGAEIEVVGIVAFECVPSSDLVCDLDCNGPSKAIPTRDLEAAIYPFEIDRRRWG